MPRRHLPIRRGSDGRQAAATCQNSVSRERALRIIDAEIETFNDRIGEQSCGQ